MDSEKTTEITAEETQPKQQEKKQKLSPEELHELRMNNIRGHFFKKGNQNGKIYHKPKRDLQQMTKLLGKKRVRETYDMTNCEIDTWERRMFTLRASELKALAQNDETPAYAKALATSILIDMKNGTSRTLNLLRDRQYGAVKKNVEVTGAGGTPLMEQKTMTPDDARELLKSLEKEY